MKNKFKLKYYVKRLMESNKLIKLDFVAKNMIEICITCKIFCNFTNKMVINNTFFIWIYYRLFKQYL
jgi:hypothetical protein